MDLSRKCGAIARELQLEVRKLKYDDGSYRRSLQKAVQSIRKTRWLKESQAKLDAYARTLDTLILIRLDTQALRRSNDFNTLDQSVRDLALKIERGRNTTERLLADQTLHIQEHFDRRFDERERRTQIDQARERFQASLFFADIEAREDEIVEAFEGTCKWIFDPPMVEGGTTRKWHNFRHWLEAGEGLYWINGKPGAGKSTLMKYIVDEPRTAQYLSKWEPDTDLVIVCFFFKNLGTELQKSALGLLRSLIWQITRDWPGMIELVLKCYGNATGQSQEPPALPLLHTWTEKRLFQVLKDFINEKPATVTLCAFIDGLDEYTGDEELLLQVIRLLSPASGCKVCVSSRPDQAFCREFQGHPQCRVQDLNKKDIEKMVIEKLKPCLERNKPTETIAINELVDDLIRNAEGVFLWLSIMIKDLTRGSNNGDRIDELHARLRVTPSTVYGQYRRILGGLDQSYLNYALKVFQILIATDHLDFHNFEENYLLGLACAEDTSWMHITDFDRIYFSSLTFETNCRELRTRLNSRCGGLIEIRYDEDEVEETIVVRHCRSVKFIHRSVVEFLEEEYGSAFGKDACLSATWIPVARAKIGLLFLFPLLKFLNDDNYGLQAVTHDVVTDGEDPSGYEGSFEDYELEHGIDGNWSDEGQLSDLEDRLFYQLMEVLRYFIELGMKAVFSGEISTSKVPSSRSLDKEKTDLTACILQTLRYMARKNDLFTIDCKHHVSMKWLLKMIEREFDINTDAQYAFQDDMSFAAFWGCESYIRTRFSPETSDEQLEAIFRSVIVGLLYKSRFEWSSEAFSLSHLNIVDFLLQEKQIPRGITASWRPYFGTSGRASPWGTFFLHTCGDPNTTDRKLDNGKPAWIQRRLDLIKKKISLGADRNTRLSLNFELKYHYELESPKSMVFIDESPLAYLQALERQGTSGDISGISTFFRSEGAVGRRRYRFWAYNATYYRINASQSKRLDEVLRSGNEIVGNAMSGYMAVSSPTDENIGTVGELVQIVEDIRSTNDHLDWDTLDKEWKRGDSNWLEEND